MRRQFRKRPKISEAAKARIEEMRERGVSQGTIARVLGVSEGVVGWHCLMEGIESPTTATNLEPSKMLMVTYRNGHAIRRFTTEEDERLLDLERRGLRYCEMAEALGRKPQSVRGRLATLARKQARAERARGEAA